MDQQHLRQSNPPRPRRRPTPAPARDTEAAGPPPAPAHRTGTSRHQGREKHALPCCSPSPSSANRLLVLEGYGPGSRRSSRITRLMRGSRTSSTPGVLGAQLRRLKGASGDFTARFHVKHEAWGCEDGRRFVGLRSVGLVPLACGNCPGPTGRLTVTRRLDEAPTATVASGRSLPLLLKCGRSYGAGLFGRDIR